MSVTVSKLLTDAKKLTTKLKDYDSKTDLLMARTQSLNKSVEAMKEYHEEVTAMSGRAGSAQRNAIIVTIQRESKQLRKLETENRDLKCAIEDYQFVLELIMSKYRQQTNQLIKLDRVERECIHSDTNNSNEVITKLMNKISEMASVMNQAIRSDENHSLKEEELIAKLRVENRTLRELLKISIRNGSLDYNTTADIDEDTTSSDDDYHPCLTKSLRAKLAIPKTQLIGGSILKMTKESAELLGLPKGSYTPISE